MAKKLVGMLLVTLLLASMLSYSASVSASKDNSVEILIRNAQKLKKIAYERLNVTLSVLSANKSLLNMTKSLNLSLIEGLLSQADTYLNLSIQLYNSGNFTGAKLYAIYAINTYDNVIEILEEFAEKAGINLEFEEAEEHLNQTEVKEVEEALNKTALLLQLQVLEARVTALEASLSKLNQSEFNLTFVFQLLDYAKTILAQTRNQLAQGNITVSILAQNLAVVKKILGLVNAELNRQSLHVTVIRAMKLGLLKKNDTAFLNQSLIIHKIPKLKEVRNRTRTGINETAAELEEIQAEVRNMSKNISKQIKEIEKKIKEEVKEKGKHVKEIEEEVDIPTASKPPKEKILPPGLKKKGHEDNDGKHEENPLTQSSQGKRK
ncbi:hypothetical protein [Infirmifilum uzonense]|uniref:hypothetical protein n=1 Tax=Infirmifilum uzonense TaxID=1550241 RepID=UPI003C720A4F